MPRRTRRTRRWLITPTTSRVGAGSSMSPHRPIPVSSLRCTRTPSGIRASAATSSRRATRASPISRSETGPMTRMRAFRSAARRWSASGSVATQSAVAPPSSAALETSTAPCPYPSALTTAHSSAPSAARSERRGVSPDRPQVEGEARPLHAVIVYWIWVSQSIAAGSSSEQVAGDESRCVRGEARGAPVRQRGRGRRGRSVEALREECADDPREHVARSRGGERRWPGVAHDDCSIRRGDDRVGALEEHRRAEAARLRSGPPRGGARRPRRSRCRAGAPARRHAE